MPRVSTSHHLTSKPRRGLEPDEIVNGDARLHCCSATAEHLESDISGRLNVTTDRWDRTRKPALLSGLCLGGFSSEVLAGLPRHCPPRPLRIFGIAPIQFNAKDQQQP